MGEGVRARDDLAASIHTGSWLAARGNVFSGGFGSGVSLGRFIGPGPPQEGTLSLIGGVPFSARES